MLPRKPLGEVYSRILEPLLRSPCSETDLHRTAKQTSAKILAVMEVYVGHSPRNVGTDWNLGSKTNITAEIYAFIHSIYILLVFFPSTQGGFHLRTGIQMKNGSGELIQICKNESHLLHCPKLAF